MSADEVVDKWGDLVDEGVIRSPHVRYRCDGCGFSSDVYTESDIKHFKKMPECPCCRNNLNIVISSLSE